MKACKALLMAAVGLCAMSMTGAVAADLDGSLKDSSDYGYSTVYGPWMVRGRILGVIPDEGTSNWIGVDPASDLDIDNSVVPELDITYFFTNNIAAELILGVTPHDITGVGGTSIDGADIGSVWLLPPTLLLQYHFELDQGIKPYVGAGVNYTVFFNEDAGNGFTSLELENSFGWALQAGVDIPIQDNWYFNIDVKKLWLDTEATVDGAVTADVDIDPWIIGVGLCYRFGGYEVPLK